MSTDVVDRPRLRPSPVASRGVLGDIPSIKVDATDHSGDEDSDLLDADDDRVGADADFPDADDNRLSAADHRFDVEAGRSRNHVVGHLADGAAIQTDRDGLLAAGAALQAAVDALQALDLSALSDASVVATLDAVETQARRLPTVRDALVQQVQVRGVADNQRFRSTGAWLRDRFLITGGEARTWLRGAERLTSRVSLTGEPLDPVLPTVSAARASGRLSPAQVKVIDDLDEELPADLPLAARREVEQQMVGFATQFDPVKLIRVGQRILDAIDPDGAEPAAEDAHRRRGITIGPLRRGLAKISGHVDAWTREAILAVLNSLSNPDPAATATAHEGAGSNGNGRSNSHTHSGYPYTPTGESVGDHATRGEHATSGEDDRLRQDDRHGESSSCSEHGIDGEHDRDDNNYRPGEHGIDREHGIDGEHDRGDNNHRPGEHGIDSEHDRHGDDHRHGEDHRHGGPGRHGGDGDGPAGAWFHHDEDEDEDHSRERADSAYYGRAGDATRDPSVDDRLRRPAGRPIDADDAGGGDARGEPDVGGAAMDPDRRSHPQRLHDALRDACERLLASGGLPRRGGTPATMLLTVPLATLEQRAGLVSTASGGDLPISEVIRRGGDATIVPIVLDAEGNPLFAGRSRRLASPLQRQALHVRDGGCVIPGCTTPSPDCHAHHLDDWARGGPTDLPNLALLCSYHHYRIGGWTLTNKRGRIWCTPPPWMNRDQLPRLNVYFRSPPPQQLFD